MFDRERVVRLLLLVEGSFPKEPDVWTYKVAAVFERERAGILYRAKRTWAKWHREVETGELVLPDFHAPLEEIENAVDEYLLAHIPPEYKGDSLYLHLVVRLALGSGFNWTHRLASRPYQAVFQSLTGVDLDSSIPLHAVFDELPNGNARLARSLDILRQHPEILPELQGVTSENVEQSLPRETLSLNEISVLGDTLSLLLDLAGGGPRSDSRQELIAWLGARAGLAARRI